MSSAPPKCMAATMAGCGPPLNGGAQAIMRFTPAPRAGPDPHMRRGDHRIASTRHVAADRIDRDVAVTEHDAGQRLDLEIAQRLLLLLGEIAYLRLRELDVVEVALAQPRYRALDLGRSELERGRRPVVELFRQLAHRRIAPSLDLSEDGFHRLAPLGIGGFDRARVHSALEIAGHGGLRSSFVVAGLAPAAHVFTCTIPKDAHPPN